MVGWRSLTGGARGGRFADRLGFVIPVILLCLLGVTVSGCKKQNRKLCRSLRSMSGSGRRRIVPRPAFRGVDRTLNPYETVNVSSELDGILKDDPRR